MKIYIEINTPIQLEQIVWSGGADTLNDLTYAEIEQVIEHMEELFTCSDVNDTDVNDFLWFERDEIASILGYNDYEELVSNRD